ncbi:Dol-P-Glc:Glc(2)Man(9)GlcNAc(2)-PP-Dol alpha-1,2-glucosyltransferase [Neonectria ditissima]|uniref:Dol-P-Glc:Glc(2)Man(9)GlcNAc(2)-PP-Dol alpha-1,2-glucosyltransferase n=1 Tax=Neonectria ditissima TaxID=78410 RepID=A0A0P7BNJ0_9HYPO|nr:Dol-P-Glc:Glc(2)Man(9)GlcNAc(2)-PP-Dol alpha-1,2-glucosyltransferase [Neonectria ditissima]
MDTTTRDAPAYSFWAASAGLFILPSYFWLLKRPEGSFTRWAGLFPATLAVACFSWLYVVSAVVPEPYLDEVFHIPQAQLYCEGKFREWDDKITTPPGLYLLSLLIPGVVKPGNSPASYLCDVESLRAASAIALMVLAYLALQCRHEIEARLDEAHSSARLRIYSQYSLHTAFNIALFPVLFFFSGLYYTDVASTAAVLGAYLNHLRRLGQDRSSFFSDLATIGLGVLTLFMRQTNVFWVVVYMGGLEAVHAIKTLRPERVDQPMMSSLAEQLKYYAWRYSLGDVHDPPLHMMFPDDMLFCVLSLGIAALCNPIHLIRQIWPYIAVIASFGSFVFWNGGVVLGDKSNHVATIHLPQMLYIWAFFGFFSLPLLLPYAFPVANIATRMFKMISSRGPQASYSSRSSFKSRESSRRTISSKKKPENNVLTGDASPPPTQPFVPSGALSTLDTIFNSKIHWPFYLLATIIFSFLIVKYNTIIHPFTLADNRHYMFYVFRYTIRRASWIRYLLVIPYTFSRWMTWGTMAGCSQWFHICHTDMCSAYCPRLRKDPFLSNPFWINRGGGLARQTGDTEFPVEVPQVSLEVEATHLRDLQRDMDNDPMLVSVEPACTSTGLIFLLATTLSLVTAPLVEPRYFIIPWVMWRLLVPGWRLHDHETPSPILDCLSSHPVLRKVMKIFETYDLRLVLETGWFITINVVTGYIFLCKPYLWRAEDGTLLDEGRLQRFMW